MVSFFSVSGFRRIAQINRLCKRRNPQIFVLPAQESEDFGRSGGIRTHGLLDPNGSKDLRRPISGPFRLSPPDQSCSLPVLSPSIPLSDFREIVKTVVKPKPAFHKPIPPRHSERSAAKPRNPSVPVILSIAKNPFSHVILSEAQRSRRIRSSAPV